MLVEQVLHALLVDLDLHLVLLLEVLQLALLVPKLGLRVLQLLLLHDPEVVEFLALLLELVEVALLLLRLPLQVGRLLRFQFPVLLFHLVHHIAACVDKSTHTHTKYGEVSSSASEETIRRRKKYLDTLVREPPSVFSFFLLFFGFFGFFGGILATRVSP